MGKNYVYMLQCSDNTFYTGWTNNLENRLRVHNTGKGSKYTRARLPVTLAYAEECATKQQAQKREYEIKQLSRTEKTALAKTSTINSPDF